MAALRQRIADQQKIIDDLNALKTQYLDETGKFKVPKEITDAIAERDAKLAQLENQLAKTNFAASSEFQSKYQAPVDSMFTQISEIVKEFGGPDGLAETLVGLPVKERLETIKKAMPDAAAVGVLVPMYASLDRLLVARHQALENHKQTAAQLQQESTVRKEQEMAILRNTMRDRALSTLEQDGYFMFSKVPGNEAWNGKVEQMKQAVDILVKSNDVELQTQALALSVAAPVYRTLYEEERAARIQLENQLRQAKNVNPLTRVSMPSTVPAPGQQQSAPPAGGLTPAAAVASIMQKISGS